MCGNNCMIQKTTNEWSPGGQLAGDLVWLPLLSARPAFTFTAEEHHCTLPVTNHTRW